MHGRGHSQFGSDTDQTVDGYTNTEIDEHAEIDLKPLVLKELRQVWDQRKVVNGLAEQDGDEVFEPASGGHAQELALCTIFCSGVSAWGGHRGRIPI
jgi:hypothetical protein